MPDIDDAPEGVDDDFDVTADLAAAFDAAESDGAEPVGDTPEPETAQQDADRVRDEKGRFAKSEEVSAEPLGAVSKPLAVAPVAEAAPDPLVPATPVKAPPGFSPTAKVVWDKEALTKEEWQAVKNDIAKRNDEVGQGFAKLAEYKPIERYSEMAKQSGTTLERALANYVGIEQELARDFTAGISGLCQRQGISPVALAQQILSRAGTSSQMDGAGNQPQAYQPASADSATAQRIAALESYIQQTQSQGVQSEIDRFASEPSNRFFENVKVDMGNLIRSGQAADLADAYDKACWANKEIRSLLIKEQSAVSAPSAKAAAANQARAASRSITGSPIPKAGSRGPETSIEDEIRSLMDASV